MGVCTNTLCAIMGGDAIWEELSDHLGVGHDETTDDGAITLERVECNAACDYAPVVMVNWEFFDNQTPGHRATAVVDDLRGRQAGRPDARRRTRCAPSRRCPACWPGSPTGGPTRASAPVSRRCAGVGWPRAEGWTAPDCHRPRTTPAAPRRLRHRAEGRRRAVQRRAPGHHAGRRLARGASSKKQSTDDAKES